MKKIKILSIVILLIITINLIFSGWFDSTYSNAVRILSLNDTFVLSINGSSEMDIDGNGNTEWIYGIGDGSNRMGLYYNSENQTIIANDSSNLFRLQTKPVVEVNGTRPPHMTFYSPLDDLIDDFNNVTDFSVQSLNLTFNGSIGGVKKAISNSIMFNGYKFNGVNGSIGGAFSNNPLNNNPNGTMVLWIRPGNKCTERLETIVGTNTGAGTEVYIEFRADSNCFAVVQGGVTVIDINLLNWSANELFMLTYTWNSDSVGFGNDNYSIYKNATFINGSVRDGTENQGKIGFYIGSQELSKYANVTVYDSKFYNISFTPDQVNTLFQMGTSLGINTTFPNISIISPPNNSRFIQSSIQVNISSNPDNGCFWTNNTGITNHTFNCLLNFSSTFANGDTTLLVYVNNTFGHENITSLNFSIDSLFPLINITSPNTSFSSTNNILVNFSIDDNNFQACWYNVSREGTVIEIGKTITTCSSGITNITILNVSQDSGDFRIWVSGNDSFGNENYSSASFSVTTPVGGASGGGGGGGTPQKVSVVAIIQPDDFNKDISNINRAILYSRIKNYTEINDITRFVDTDFENLKNILQENNILLTKGELELWINNFNTNKIEAILVDEADVETYGLILSTIVITPLEFQLIPQRIERPWILTECIGGDNIFKQTIRSSKFLSSCEVDTSNKEGFSCETSFNSTSSILTFEEKNPNYFSQRIEGTIKYTSVDGQNTFQTVGLTAYNLCSKTKGGIPIVVIFISIVALGTIVLIVLFRKTKKGKEIWDTIKRQF